MKNKIAITILVFSCVFFLGGVLKTSAAEFAEYVEGWLWGGSEDANIGTIGSRDGNETGVGWIETDPASSYSVFIPKSGCVGLDCKVTGYAWNKNMGWIDFNPQDHCVVRTPSGPPVPPGKYKAKSCTPPYSVIPYVYRDGNDLKGWARFVGIAQESAENNSGGWGGWIQMYNVSINTSTGYLLGYGWNGEDNPDNPDKNIAKGLGWIEFKNLKLKCDGYTPNCINNVRDTSVDCSIPANAGALIYKTAVCEFTSDCGDGDTEIKDKSACGVGCDSKGDTCVSAGSGGDNRGPWIEVAP